MQIAAQLQFFVTYDGRLFASAQLAGLPVAQPLSARASG